MEKFKIGDMVVGIDDEYSITKKGWIGYVIDTDYEQVKGQIDDICISTNKDASESDANTFWVHSEHFELIDSKDLKFKIGEKVLVKKDLENIENFIGHYVPKMEIFEGKVVTIEKFFRPDYRTERNAFGVHIKEDENNFIWDIRAFEKIKEVEVKVKMKTEVETEKTEKAEPSYKDEIKELTKTVKDLTKKLSSKSQFEKAVTEGIIEKGKEIAVEDIKEKLLQDTEKFITEKYGVIPITLKVETEEKVVEVTGLFHKDFQNILKVVKKNVPLMLVGPAGSGKNHTLEQVAKALDLDFYFTNAVTQEYKLTGFIDANGTYHETEFYKAFMNGGLFFLDEMDASCPESLIVLNSAIANGYFDFPTGRVYAHENFRVVAAANTYGTGADMVYVGRNVLDGATLDRFVVFNFDYDEAIEKTLAKDEELYNFIVDLRNAINEGSLRYIISMRATINASKLLEVGLDKEMILKNAIIKNMTIDDINTIIKKMKNQSNEWFKILERMSKDARD